MWLHIPKEYLASAVESEDLISESPLLFKETAALSCTSNGKPMLQRSWQQGLKKGGYVTRLSGLILKASTLNRGAEKWMASLEDIPASPSQRPANAEAKQTLVGSGQTSPASFATSSPHGASLKTSPTMSTSASNPSGETFEQWVSTWKPDSLKRLKLARATYAGDCSFSQDSQAHRLGRLASMETTKMWPTPIAHDVHKGNPARVRKSGTQHGCSNLNDWVAMWPTPVASPTNRSPTAFATAKARPGAKNRGPDLSVAVKMWPTPTARDHKSIRASPATHDRNSRPLSEVVGQMEASTMWPTPTVCGNYNKKGLSKTSGDGLATAAKMWPTPVANDAKGDAPSNLLRNTPPLRTVARLHGNTLETTTGERTGALAPEFCEFLQGFLIGWVSLEPLEMQ